MILVGGMASGKSTVGWHLARLIGAGFIDLDQWIEKREGRKIQQIFEDKGEEYFREVECRAVAAIADVRSHVLSMGGGSLVEDANWETLRGLGVMVWLNPPPTELARRLGADPAALANRPLLADLLNHKDWETRHKLLAERMSALVGHRADRYKQADLIVSDCFATPETTARVVKDALVREGLLKIPAGRRPFDRWGPH